jgi:hypothetical protein
VPAGGGEALQVTRQGGYNPFASKDGKTIYYTKTDSDRAPLWEVPVEGGDESQVLDSVSRDFAAVPGGVYFASPSRLVHFDFSTGITKPILTIAKPRLTGLSVSPDERWLLYTQLDQSGMDLMLVENFR